MARLARASTVRGHFLPMVDGRGSVKAKFNSHQGWLPSVAKSVARTCQRLAMCVGTLHPSLLAALGWQPLHPCNLGCLLALSRHWLHASIHVVPQYTASLRFA